MVAGPEEDLRPTSVASVEELNGVRGTATMQGLSCPGQNPAKGNLEDPVNGRERMSFLLDEKVIRKDEHEALADQTSVPHTLRERDCGTFLACAAPS